MKQRTAKKLNARNAKACRTRRYDFPKRLFNKMAYVAIVLEGHLTITYSYRCYIMARDGRLMVYSGVTKDGQNYYGPGHRYWHEGY